MFSKIISYICCCTAWYFVAALLDGTVALPERGEEVSSLGLFAPAFPGGPFVLRAAVACHRIHNPAVCG